MKIVGIITEYNPFHNGHLYQLRRAKELSGADYAVAVMSGSFVQRGEPAICDKWARAKMAVSCGVDLVVELPVVYSVQSAEFFAMGAVKILNAINTDYISFGVEDDNLQRLTDTAYLLCNEPPEFKSMLCNGLKCGDSFPAAREAAARSFGAADVLLTPNNILGVEYIKALIKTSSKMKPVPIKRIGSQHDCFGSASHIRSISPENAKEFMPPDAYEIFLKEIENGKAPVNIKSIEAAVISKLRLISSAQLARISGVSEGLENRIKQAAAEKTSVEDIVDFVKTKRYTHSRIRRIMINALLDITKEEITKPPQYIRVLGLGKGGREVLRGIKNDASLPIITKTSSAKKADMLCFDMAATDIYSLMYPDKRLRIGNLDFFTSPIVCL